MPSICFITGGSRSGKSQFALDLALTSKLPKIFLATSPRLDPEMDSRIQRHQEDRKDLGFQTIEEELQIVKVLQEMPEKQCVLLDCLGLWINNLLYHTPEVTEDQVKEFVEKVAQTSRAKQHDLIVVSNETGMGLIGDSPVNRRFVDLLGRANQSFGKEADRVEFMVSGLNLTLKAERTTCDSFRKNQRN